MQLGFNLAGIKRIAQIMARPFSNVTNQLIGKAQFRLHHFRNLIVALFLMRTDIKDLAQLTMTQNQINGRAVVFDVQPVTPVGTLTVNGKRSIAQRVLNQHGQQFFMMLTRAKVVRAARNADWHAKRAHHRHRQHICPRFAGSVWRTGTQRIGFLSRLPRRHRTIDLIS